MTYMATPKHKNPCTWGHEIYNFGKPIVELSLLYTKFILNMSQSGEEDSLRNSVFSLYFIYGHAVAHKNPPWGS